MQFFNQTQKPTPLLIPIIELAGSFVGARTQKTVVLVTQNRKRQTTGIAYNYHTVSSSRLLGETQQVSKKYITDGGWIHLRLPQFPLIELSHSVTKRLWYVCLHEWAHIKDLQNGGPKKLPWSRDNKQAWIDRPEEQRAELRVLEICAKIQTGYLKDPSFVLIPFTQYIIQKEVGAKE